MLSISETLARAVDPESVGPTSAPALPLSYRRLLTALLEDCFLCRDSHSVNCRKQRAQDEAWLRSQDDGPFSFVFVCEQLDLDPAAVRAAYFVAHANERDRIPFPNTHTK
jgi:hypothetical protein